MLLLSMLNNSSPSALTLVTPRVTEFNKMLGIQHLHNRDNVVIIIIKITIPSLNNPSVNKHDNLL